MANYSITINSKFRPFSFQEMIAPLTIMEQNHREVEEQYANLMTESAKWENLANEQTDKIAYNQYKRYALDLELAADKLAKEGITANSRPSMYKLKSRYNSEIAPIEAAYNLRAADIKAQNDFATVAGGQAIFTKKAITTSLDDYLNGKPLDYSSTNLLQVEEEGRKAGESMSKRYMKTTEGQLFKGDYYDLKTTTGFTDAEILDILNRSGKYPLFEKFINDTLTKHGYSKYSNDDKLKMEGALLAGINMGITYEEKNTPMENWRKKADYDYALDVKKMEKQAALNHYYSHLDGGSDGLGVQHLDTPIDEDVDSYKDVRNIYTSRGGMNSKYFSKNSSGKAKDWINPMEVYEYWNSLTTSLKKKRIKERNEALPRGGGIAGFNSADLVNSNTDSQTVLNAVKKKYGNVSILTTSQYNKLKKLGYNSKSKRNDFEVKNFNDKIDNRALLYTPTSVNLTQYNFAQDRLSSRIPDYEKSKNKSSIYEYKNGKVTTESAKLKNYLNKDGKFNATVKDVAYSIQNPDYILYITDMGTIAMKAEGDTQRKITKIVKTGLANIDEEYRKGKISFSEMTQRKSDLQDDAAGALQLYENSRVPVKGNTSASLWGTGEGDSQKK